MTYRFVLLFSLCSLSWGMAQIPNVCVTPPSPYKLGGSFAIIVQKNGIASYDDNICVSPNGISQTIAVINEDRLTLSNEKYLFDVKDDITVPLPNALALNTFETVTKANVGNYWIMQVGEAPDGQPILSCRLLKVNLQVKEDPLKFFTADYEPTGEVTVRIHDEVPQKPVYSLYTSNRFALKDRYEFPELVDTSPNVDGTDCYVVSFEGGCQTESEFSAPFCALYLESGMTNLFWNNLSYSVPANIQYSLWQISPTGLEEKVMDDITNGTFTIDQPALKKDFLFYVQGNVQFPDLSSTTPQVIRSNRVKLKPRVYPFLPTVFTPNGDGTNEFFEVANPSSFSEFHIQVFDRLGQIVWVSTSTNGFLWDGNGLKDNQPVPPGIYTYQLAYRFGSSDFEKIIGKVEIMR